MYVILIDKLLYLETIRIHMVCHMLYQTYFLIYHALFLVICQYLNTQKKKESYKML